MVLKQMASVYRRKMMRERYNVVFEGKIMPGKDVKMVKDRLKALMKTDDDGIERLFIGKPVVVRKKLEKDIAEKYRNAFAQAGAMCDVKQDAPLEQNSAPESDPAPAAPGPVPEPPKPEVRLHYITTADGVKMIITNIETVPGKTIAEHFGLVSGSTIRAKHIGRDFMASLKNLVGGELKGYTQLLQESRKQAMDRMIEQSRQLGANAIVNVRFSTSSVAQGAAELYAYGTAVRVE